VGVVVAEDDSDRKRWPEQFSPVNPNRLTPEEALRAKATMERTGSDGRTRVVHIGQWVHRDDELLDINLHTFEAV
jgi:hypothetical protein